MTMHNHDDHLYERETMHALKSYVMHGVPADVDLWPRVRQAIDERSRETASRERRRSKRQRALIAAALCTVGAAGTIVEQKVAASLNPVDSITSFTPSFADVVARSLATTVDASRSAYGYTTTVNKVYADANVVFVVSTFQGPATRSFAWISPYGQPELIDDATNTSLRYLYGLGDATHSFAVFSTGDTAPAPGTTLHATYRTGGAVAYEHMNHGQDIPPSYIGETYESTGTVRPDLDSTGPTRRITVASPVSISLGVPVQSEVETATPRLTHQVGPDHVTLDKVVVTPTFARVYVSFDGANANYDNATLTAGGRTIFPLSAYLDHAGRGEVFDFANPLLHTTGLWRINIQTVTGPIFYNTNFDFSAPSSAS